MEPEFIESELPLIGGAQTIADVINDLADHIKAIDELMGHDVDLDESVYYSVNLRLREAVGLTA
jgi:hypothetical protein